MEGLRQIKALRDS